MSNDREAFSKNLRNKIKAQIDHAAEERKRDLFRRRVDIARIGILAYENKEYSEAVKNFHTYLRILEEGKHVAEWGLTPSHFDQKADQAELLLISGVYWDMAKIYDRTRTAKGKADFARYLDKYVLFSKGMPFEPLCAEALRKYIAYSKGVNREAFKEAYKKLAITRCFVATELVAEVRPETIPVLREFRDLILKKSTMGRAFVLWYYRVGPQIADGISKRSKTVRFFTAQLVDVLAILARYLCKTVPMRPGRK